MHTLRSEVARLRIIVAKSQQDHAEKMIQYANEEKHIREENERLQEKLKLEVT